MNPQLLKKYSIIFAGTLLCACESDVGNNTVDPFSFPAPRLDSAQYCNPYGNTTSKAETESCMAQERHEQSQYNTLRSQVTREQYGECYGRFNNLTIGYADMNRCLREQISS